MLDKLIANLKESLPASLRKKLGEEGDDDQLSEDSDESNEDSHDTVAPENDPKKKQLSMVIRVIVVLGLGYLAVDQFLLKEGPVENSANINVKPRKSRKKPMVPAVDSKAANVGAPPPAPAEASSTTLSTAPLETSPAPTIEAPVSEPLAETVVAPVENINIAEKVATEPVVDVAPPAISEIKVNEAQVDKSIDSLIDSVDGPDKKKPEADNGEKKEIRLEDKIVADDVYTPPPAYDQIGRGLVYNCKEKYWSCVDKSSYVSCNKNMKWNKTKAKTAECVVQNVYNSEEDCNLVQKYNISTGHPTTFCQ